MSVSSSQSGQESQAVRNAGSNPTLPAATGGDRIAQWAFFAGFQLAGFWLIVLIATAVFIAVVTFSAAQFQARLSGLVLDGGALSVWKAEQLRQVWSASLDALRAAQETLAANQRARTKLIEEINVAEIQQTEAFAKIDPLHRKLVSDIKAIDATIGNRIANESPVSLTPEEISKLKPQYPKIESDLDNLNSALTAYYTITQRIESLKQRAASLDATIRRNIEELKRAQSDADLTLPQSASQKEQEQLTQIKNVIYEFHAMRSFLGGAVYLIALAPSDILVLVLVVVMGLLGSSLHLSYIYVNEYAARPITFYLFRPFLGIIMALAIYIVAKAGIPLFTDTTRTGGTAPVNPYFISFLGIISGLLSERALEALQQLGSNYFREGKTEPNRWSREGLREQFKAVNRDPKKLLPILKAKETEFEAWLDGVEPVPPNVQGFYLQP